MDQSALVTLIGTGLFITVQAIQSAQKKLSGRTDAERRAAKATADALSLAERRAEWDRSKCQRLEDYAVELRAWCLTHHGLPQPPPPLPDMLKTLGPRP